MGMFLWLSDLHLDPYYGTADAASSHNDQCILNATASRFPYGQPGCDAPMALINETLDHITSTISEEEADFVIITGDFARHQTDLLEDGVEEAQHILETISRALQSAFPSTPILPCTGNNDFYPDYALDLTTQGSNNPSLIISLRGFQSLLSEEELATFAQGGFYARSVSDSLTILSLNTVMYSVNHLPDQTYLEDPMGQFAWLDAQLQTAFESSKTVWIVGHIPPTIGSYRHSQFWHQQYVDRYFGILDKYPIVKGHLFGHLHSEEFRLLQPSQHDLTIPLYISSSVTPVYGANPSY